MAPAPATPPRVHGAGPHAAPGAGHGARATTRATTWATTWTRALARCAAPAVLLGLGGLGGCFVCPASDAALLDVGFRSPEQAFRTFQTAVRSDEPDLEFRCLSGGFRRGFEPPLSRLTYLEARDAMHRENRWLRTGIARARIDAVERLDGGRGPRRARIRATSFGRALEIDLVQEDFAELWGADAEAPVLEREIAFADHVDVQAASDGSPWVTAGVPLPAGVAASDVTELRLGREWKIDGFREVDDDADRSAEP